MLPNLLFITFANSYPIPGMEQILGDLCAQAMGASSGVAVRESVLMVAISPSTSIDVDQMNSLKG